MQFRRFRACEWACGSGGIFYLEGKRSQEQHNPPAIQRDRGGYT